MTEKPAPHPWQLRQRTLPTEGNEMTNLTDYATNELNLAGLMDPDSDYDGMLGRAALEIVKLFASQGHSGMSASIVTELAGRLMRYEPLTPLTYGPEEWMNVSDMSESPMWQNIRKSDVFSVDRGETHYCLGDPAPKGKP